MIYSFEHGVPAGITAENSNIKISDKHCKDGQNALVWEMDGKASLSIKGDVNYHIFKDGGRDQNRDNFVVWLYRERVGTEPLRIEFLKNGKLCCHFDFGQEFHGWRTCWVPFRDMDGTAEEGMDEIRMVRSGTEPLQIWIDQLISSVPIDPRHSVRDVQVPFVNPSVDTAVNAHWTSLLRFSLLEKEAFAKIDPNEPVAEDVKQEIEAIRTRLKEHIMNNTTWPKNGHIVVTEDECNEHCQEYDRFHLRPTADGLYSGTNIDAGCHKVAYPTAEKDELMELTGSVDIKECSNLMLETAYAWQAATPEQKKKLAACYNHMMLHLFEQGWAAGSSVGTTHHLGYPMRSLYTSVFLMEEPLREAGILKEATEMIAWFSGRGRCFRDPAELWGESIDTLNTLLQGILCSILMMETSPYQVACLNAMKRWLSTSLRPANGLGGPFKIDGSAFHHANHYPAYAMGGFRGVAPIVYALSGTRFCLGKEAHHAMRKCLLYMRIYCNRYNWMISMSSRHPKGVGEMSQISTIEPFYYLALAGKDSDGVIDEEMAGAFLRLAEYVNFPRAKKLLDLGYKPEKAPEGYYSMNYACAGIHRRDEWMAGVRGHSRYIWGNESYARNNLYGRYVAYGNLQILGSGEPVNNTDSGFWQEGWDWNCYPGTTTVMLPVDELKQDVRVVDSTAGVEEMLLSDEAFAGGVSFQNRQGAFAMKLHGHAKYDGTLRARKSWFFFDDHIVCLGSNIEDARPGYHTVTTLYQHYLGAEHLKDAPAKAEIVDMSADHIFTDPSGNRYRVPAGSCVKKSSGVQESRAQDTCEPTWGAFEKVWLDHGIDPSNEGYEYMIRVKATGEEPAELPYEVLEKSRNLHAVRDSATGITAYAFFEPAQFAGSGAVKSVDRSCLLMEEVKGNELNLSFCDPDLHLYEGEEPDQKNPDGTQKEVSLYSRKWLRAASIPHNTVVTLNGHWELDTPVENVVLNIADGNTQLTYTAKDGLTTELCLHKIAE